jgi:hypothetical protein
LVLKFRVLGFILNQLFLEVFFFQKQMRNRKKKKPRLFLLETSKRRYLKQFKYFDEKKNKISKIMFKSYIRNKLYLNNKKKRTI